LKSLGYKNSIGILNAADFGSSQARRRVFMISSLKSQTKLPIGNKKPQPINKILNKQLDEKNLMPALDKYDLSDFKLTKSNIKKAQLKDYSSFNSETYVYDEKYSGPTLTASGANSRIKIKNNGKIRKLNAEEAFAYMGFKKSDFRKVNSLNILNETKMIYTCGNSISIEVLQAIMKEIVNEY
jgi:DNA (cytosine-5)-methyltransferase 1